jgi:hypothetical protein
MTVATRKGDAGLADILAGRIVRSRGRCQYPGCTSTEVQWAHIIRRNYGYTRCMEDAAWSLCGTHHFLVDNWPDEHQALVALTIGDDRYRELKAFAHAGKPAHLTAKLWWSQELERLKARCRELGLSDKRAA